MSLSCVRGVLGCVRARYALYAVLSSVLLPLAKTSRLAEAPNAVAASFLLIQVSIATYFSPR